MGKIHKVARELAIKLAAAEMNAALQWRKDLERNLEGIAENKIPPYRIPVRDRQAAERVLNWVKWLEPALEAYDDALYYVDDPKLSVVYKNTMAALQKVHAAAEQQRPYLHPQFYQSRIISYINGIWTTVQQSFQSVGGTAKSMEERQGVAGKLMAMATFMKKIANSKDAAPYFTEYPATTGIPPQNIIDPLMKVANTIENTARFLQSKKPVNGPALRAYLMNLSNVFDAFPWDLIKFTPKWKSDLGEIANAVADMR